MFCLVFIFSFYLSNELSKNKIGFRVTVSIKTPSFIYEKYIKLNIFDVQNKKRKLCG